MAKIAATFVVAGSAQLVVPTPSQGYNAIEEKKEFEQMFRAREANIEKAKHRPLAEALADSTLTINEPDLCDNTVQQYSGYFKLGDSKKKYFFWFFESRNDPANDPTVMWLTGGPGCSSMMALMAENGPCNLQQDGSPVRNEFSWNSKANAFWIDQPPGTGFSTCNLQDGCIPDHSEDGVSQDMYLFLQKMFQHEKMKKYNKRFFVTGEVIVF